MDADQLRDFLSKPMSNRGEEFMKRNQPSPEAQPSNAIAQHDSAIRNHLAGLVRALLQEGDPQKLHDLLIEHRNFIDSILDLLNPKT
ncbi:MAG: hypothetical protein H3C43_12310 [Leptonema sp. (in: Bacteria)]|nr:hypothetical protein [Leptonema sp. (in: bacteria)]